MNEGLLRALRHRRFALLWSGQTLSRVGDFLYDIAIMWWVLQETGSAVLMGTVFVVNMAPTALFTLLGGVVVDRLPRVRTMIASDLARAAVTGTIAYLAISGHLTIPILLVASALSGLVEAFFQPAYTAILPEIVPEDDLPSANALTSMSIQAARVVGPPAGALVVAAAGTAPAFAFNAASFVVAAAVLLPLLAGAERPKDAQAEGGILSELAAGFAFVRQRPWLWVNILVGALGNVGLAGPFSVAMPFLMEAKGAGVGGLGYYYAVFPVGYLLGGMWIGRQVRLHRPGVLAEGGVIAAGLMLAAFALPVPIWALTVAALINGAGLELFSVVWISSLQRMVPPEKLGRVASIDQVGSIALLPVGYFLAGWATEAYGPEPVFVAGGVGTALVALAALAHPAVRGMVDVAPAVEGSDVPGMEATA